MCMLSYYPPAVLPDAERLANGCEQNRDGYGFALITARNELLVRRGMSADDMIDAFVIARGLHPEGPAMFHSRWATSGTIDTSMCHPFPVGRDSRSVVAHNGVFFSPKGNQSDTAIFARSVLPQYSLDRPSKRLRLERYLAGNKIVILTTNPRYRQSAYLFGESLGHWVADDGKTGTAHECEWHSNRDYEGGWSRYASSGAWNLDDDEWIGYAHGTSWAGKGREGATGWPTEMGPRVDACELCNGDVDEAGVCVQCDSCQECWDVRTDCQCYVPRAWRRAVAHERGDDGYEYSAIRDMSDAEFQAYLQRKYGKPQLALPAVPTD